MDILKLSQYEARNHSETANSKGFVNYGTDNMFPQYLVELYYSSATHNALTTTIGMMIFGEGFDASTLDGRIALTNGISTTNSARHVLILRFKAALLWR